MGTKKFLWWDQIIRKIFPLISHLQNLNGLSFTISVGQGLPFETGYVQIKFSASGQSNRVAKVSIFQKAISDWLWWNANNAFQNKWNSYTR